MKPWLTKKMNRWNGRQIRNAFQTAISIGQYERLKKISEAEARGEEPDKTTRYIKLSVGSFRTVAETANDFERYITKTRGDDRQRAAEQRFRKDDHSLEPPPRKNYSVRESRYNVRTEDGPDRVAHSSRRSNRNNSEDVDDSPALRRTVRKGKEADRKSGPTTQDDNSGRDMRSLARDQKEGNTSIEEIIEDDSEHDED